EAYVEERTNNYSDEFNNFLTFDGSLSIVSAYNATMTLAYDTSFGLNENLSCVWMDQNYNWSNSVFRNRCGESLNLAVNAVADVLHTFYVDVAMSEFPSEILLPLLMALTVIVLFFSKRKKIERWF
ncbi:MAG TPA: hypothetical protein VMS95_03860, partial [Candidatus Krumholzibacteriaceae bacterium]|nr:hypothetical protein [Candidatus Krumholzibacteriaceae bacterium]